MDPQTTQIIVFCSFITIWGHLAFKVAKWAFKDNTNV